MKTTKEKPRSNIFWGIVILGTLLIMFLIFFPAHVEETEKLKITCNIPFDVFIQNQTYNVSIKDGNCTFTTEINLEDLK